MWLNPPALPACECSAGPLACLVAACGVHSSHSAACTVSLPTAPLPLPSLYPPGFPNYVDNSTHKWYCRPPDYTKCYMYLYTKDTWSNHRATCQQQLNGDLVAYETMQEQASSLGAACRAVQHCLHAPFAAAATAAAGSSERRPRLPARRWRWTAASRGRAP